MSILSRIYDLDKKDLVLYIFLAITFTLLLVFSFTEFIWVDEGYSLMTSSRSLGYAFEKSLTFELQPPLYYVLLSLWRDINSSIPFAKLFSVLLLMASAFPLKALLKIHFGSRHQVFTMIFLSNLIILNFALEIRYEMLVILLVIILEYLFHISYLASPTKIRLRVFYIIVSILGVYTQYYFSFILIANFILLLFYRKKSVSIYLLDMIWPVLSLVFVFPYLQFQLNQSQTLCEMDVSGLYYFKFIYYSLEDILLQFFPFFKPLIKFIYHPFFFAGFFVILFVLNWKYKISNPLKGLYFFKLILLMAMYAVLSTLLNVNTLWIRYYTVMFIALWIFLFSIINMIPYDKWVYILSVSLILLSLGYFVQDKIRNPKGEDHVQIAHYLMEHEMSRENIFVYRNEIPIALNRVYEGKNKIIPIPEKVTPEDTYDLTDWRIKDYSQVDSIFQRHRTPYLWLITEDNTFEESRYCIDFNDDILNRYISDHFEIVSEKAICGLDVRKLKWSNGSKKEIAATANP